MSYRLASLVAVAITLAPTAAQASARRYLVDPEASLLGYHVRTKVFLLFDEDVSGQARPQDGELVVDGPRATGWVALRAGAFNSGIASRDRNVADILESPRFPLIRFDLDSLTGLGPGAPSGRGVAHGRLRVRDRSAPVTFPVDFSVTAGRFEMAGEFQSTFSAFGLAPPVLGMIAKRAPDALVLRARLLGREVVSRASR
jgi:polyisoprenoid-binding protein YceI